MSFPINRTRPKRWTRPWWRNLLESKVDWTALDITGQEAWRDGAQRADGLILNNGSEFWNWWQGTPS